MYNYLSNSYKFDMLNYKTSIIFLLQLQYLLDKYRHKNFCKIWELLYYCMLNMQLSYFNKLNNLLYMLYMYYSNYLLLYHQDTILNINFSTSMGNSIHHNLYNLKLVYYKINKYYHKASIHFFKCYNNDQSYILIHKYQVTTTVNQSNYYYYF